MKRVSPRPPRDNNEVSATGQWHGTLTATACIWRKNVPDASNAANVLFVAAAAALLTLALVAPVYFLGLGIAGLTAFAKGLNPVPSTILSNPVLWIPLMGPSILAGLLILLLATKSNVVAFTFDAGTNYFEYVEKRCLLPPATRRIPFESIVEVVPTLMTTYATSGHFDIVTREKGAGTRSLWLGDDIPLATLEAHSDWLLHHLDKRVQPVLRLDC
ncbi:hypothetical protein [Pseudoduganella sp. HUAS MS19]